MPTPTPLPCRNQPCRNQSYRDQFRQIDPLLGRHQALWRPAPFHADPPWVAAHPDLCTWLMNRSDAEVAALQGDDRELLRALSPVLPDADTLAALINIPLRHIPVAADQPRWQCDVPGRKWAQVTAFAGALGKIDLPMLEWCSGKSHLGRLLGALHGVPATGLDIDEALVADGNALAARLHLDARVHRCDVMSAAAEDFLFSGQHAVALHACGGLHVRLLQLGSEAGVERLSVAPCCYHLHGEECYRPLSTQAARSALALTRDDLRLAVRQSVTSAPRTQRRRAQLQAWRLGFDLLQRELRGVDEYLPVPPLPERLLAGDFAGFCRHVAALKALPVPESVDVAMFEQRGLERFQRVERLSLVPMAFRRALELWLVLDRVLFLQARGYECQLTQFCPPALTPRNLLIDARRAV